MQSLKYPIHEWAIDDQPREKLLRKNPQSLSDTELLAILIGNGTAEYNALELARQVFSLGHNNLQQLGRLSIEDLKSIKGIGAAKASTIAAALELGRRRQASEALSRRKVRDAGDLASWLQTTLKDFNHEVFGVVFLNMGCKMINFEIISQGGLTSTIADPRIILKRALEQEAVYIILSHNHPSGNLSPSKPDIDLTTKIKEGASYLDIKVLDHLIVSQEGYYSFANNGLL